MIVAAPPTTVPMDAIRTFAMEVDREARFPTEAIAALRESGLLGLGLPAAYGGPGGSPREVVPSADTAATSSGVAPTSDASTVSARTGQLSSLAPWRSAGSA